MQNSLEADPEPAWAGRVWYGSVFGVWCALSAVAVVVTIVKHEPFRWFVGPWYFAVFALALHSFLIAMRPNPPSKKLSLRISLLTVLGVFPWILRAFLG
jgi:hypothetical protein